MKKKYVVLAAVSGFLIALDQLTKMYIHTHYQLGESTVLIPGYFNFTYVRNFGAAFGFLAQSHQSFREIFFLSMPPIALLVILVLLRSVRDNDWKQILALSFIFGGAIGNYIDRVRFRYVIDFLDFHYHDRFTWPAFNIADSAIVGGVTLLLFLMLTEKQEEDEKNKPRSAKA